MSSSKSRNSKPLNREPDIETLLSSFLTRKANYDRNHSAVPKLTDESHVITIHGLVNHPISLSIKDLRTNFEQHAVIACLVCAGNRRHTMRTEIKEVQGIDWFDGAVQNCIWQGPLLADVLQTAGIDSRLVSDDGEYSGHLECVAVPEPCEDTSVFGGSIPLSQALDPDSKCILALSMNGEPLSGKRGCPVRAVFPGIIGARWVKWISELVVRYDESQNHYQQYDYKQLPPEAKDKESAAKFWNITKPMMDNPINSIIGFPRSGSIIKREKDKTIIVRGYAVPQGSCGPIVRVEVSADDGETWTNANLDYGGVEASEWMTFRWSWCLWTAQVRVSRGRKQRLLSRATDLAGNVQPSESPWNVRGVGYNAWGESKDLEIV